jgi:hypothetical protein
MATWFQSEKSRAQFYTVDSIKLARKLTGDITGRRCLNYGTFRKNKCFYKNANSGKQKEIYILN